MYLCWVHVAVANAGDALNTRMCKSMATQIETFGLLRMESSRYIEEVVASFRSGQYMEYLVIDTPNDGRRYITVDLLFADGLFLRKGRTQIVSFGMLKRLPRSNIKMDYLVVITPDDEVDEHKVGLVVKKSSAMGVRLFPIWAGRNRASLALQRLAENTRGQVIDFSGSTNPCAQKNVDNREMALDVNKTIKFGQKEIENFKPSFEMVKLKKEPLDKRPTDYVKNLIELVR